MSWQWLTGEPYALALDPKETEDTGLGRLPNPLIVNASAFFTPGGGPGPFRVFADIRNLLDRRVPQFNFTTFPATNVSASHFLQYYLLTGETGGYTNPSAGYSLRHVDNPATRSAGRTIRLGVEMRW